MPQNCCIVTLFASLSQLLRSSDDEASGSPISRQGRSVRTKKENNIEAKAKAAAALPHPDIISSITLSRTEKEAVESK